MIKLVNLLLCLFFLMGISTISMAQNGTVSSGGIAQGVGGTASYSVGEVAYTTISGNGGIVIEGLQQSYNVSDLPVSLFQFAAEVTENKEVVVNWVTISEINNQYYSVERSKDGVSFETVSQCKSSGNNFSKQSYRAVDSHPLNGISYYRLKQTDVDGKSSYSSLVSINITSSELGLTAFPNPTVSYLNLQVSTSLSKNLNYAIYTIDGKLVSQQKISNNLTTIGTANLFSGTYILQVTENNKIVKSFRIIKN